MQYFADNFYLNQKRHELSDLHRETLSSNVQKFLNAYILQCEGHG